MNFNQIRYFLTVADTLNFTSAANACAVSQPALSKAIRNLEETLGADLFDRSTQQVALTEFSRTMRVHFERIEEIRRKALEAAKIATTKSIEPPDVGVMCTVGPARFSRFLESIRHEHPHIGVTLHDVTPAIIPELLLSGGLDCVICARAAKHDQRFKVLDLFQEKMVVAFAPGHRFAEHDTVPLSEIVKEPYLDRLHCEYRDDFMAYTKGSGLTLDVVLRSEREDWIRELLTLGLGVCVLPASSAASPAIDHRPIRDEITLRSLELVMTADAAMAPVLSDFCDAAANFDWR